MMIIKTSTQPIRNFKVISQSYQAGKGHGIFKIAHYYSDIEYNKKPKDRKDWFYNCIKRFIKNPKVKCISYNHNAHSAYLYEHYVPSAIINKYNNELNCNLTTDRYKWHSLVIFD